MTTDPITPLDISCPACAAPIGTRCTQPRGYKHMPRAPHNARIEAAEHINRENRRKEGAK